MPDARQYWAEQMDEAWDFMHRLLAHPIEECGEALASLPDAADAVGVAIDFPDGLKMGQWPRIFAVRESLIPLVLGIAEDLLRHDCQLRIEDAYRSMNTQARGACSDFVFETVLQKVTWELGGARPTPDLLFRRIAVLTATTPKFANHMFGSVLDVTVLRYPDGSELDRGASYVDLSERTPMTSPFVSADAQRNRAWINEIFAAHGFVPYPYEFWHYSHGDVDFELITGSGQPARFGPVHWDAETGRVEPVPDACEWLLSEADIAERLAQI